MAEGFLDLMPLGQVEAALARFGAIRRTERVTLAQACGRVTAAPVHATGPLPSFDRSLMDGYALCAAEGASASETSPVFFELAGSVAMGAAAPGPLSAGQAMAVPTGAMLPAGADAVVMIEHTRRLPDGRIEVLAAAAPGQHVLRAGDDLAAGSLLLPAGRLIAPLDLGALAASSLVEIEVVCRPRVAILSTGDELVEPGQQLAPGQVPDTNATTLAVQVRAAGGEPVFAGRIPDQYDLLIEATRRARDQSELVLLSGGSSVGARDHTAQVLAELAQAPLLVAGVAISPGKPTLVADLGGVPAFGMPGHPVSSFVVFHVVVAPLLRRLAGLTTPLRPPSVRGLLTANLPGAQGRDTYHRVQLRPQADGPLQVVPVPGQSAVYTSLLRSDGLLRVPADQEGWARGEEVEVELLR